MRTGRKLQEWKIAIDVFKSFILPSESEAGKKRKLMNGNHVLKEPLCPSLCDVTVCAAKLQG
jgi:hypothetical protein